MRKVIVIVIIWMCACVCVRPSLKVCSSMDIVIVDIRSSTDFFIVIALENV